MSHDHAPHDRLSRVHTWIFDLDNTLYPPGSGIFDQVGQRMTDYVAAKLGLAREAAEHLRDEYWRLYGTTLAGLIHEHGMEPMDYLRDVHDVSLDSLSPDAPLAAAIADLPGRRIIHTNGSAEYAGRVLAARGLSGLFDAVYGVEDAEFHPKPGRLAFETIARRDGLDPARAAMFEDDPRNLLAPHQMGMATIHVAPQPEPAPHIHHHTDDLAGFLRQLRR